MYIFQSEQVIKLRFWLKNNLADISVAISQPIGLSCGCDTGMLHMPKPTNIAELKTALLSMWNDLPQEFTDKAILQFRKKTSRSSILCCCSWQTLWTHRLNIETAADIHYWNVWSIYGKVVQSLIRY